MAVGEPTCTGNVVTVLGCHSSSSPSSPSPALKGVGYFFTADSTEGVFEKSRAQADVKSGQSATVSLYTGFIYILSRVDSALRLVNSFEEISYFNLVVIFLFQENVARYVSMIPYVSDSVTFPGMCDIWSTCDVSCVLIDVNNFLVKLSKLCLFWSPSSLLYIEWNVIHHRYLSHLQHY